jgi:hypothetical protein
MARKIGTGITNRSTRPWNCAVLTNKSNDSEAHKDDYVITIYDARKKKGSEKSSENLEARKLRPPRLGLNK